MDLFGNSSHVVALLERTAFPGDIFLYNCREMTTDLLQGWAYSAHWIPRVENEVCDGLAKAATASGRLDLWVADSATRYAAHWR